MYGEILKYYLFLILIFFVSKPCLAQDYSIILEDIKIITDDSPQTSITGSVLIDENSGIKVNSAGTISLGNDWINHGNFLPGSGYVIFKGETHSTIQSNNTATFSYLIIDKNESDTKVLPENNLLMLNDLDIHSGIFEVEDITVEINNDLNIYYGGILENKSDLPYLIKVSGNVYNDSELNNNGWLEIGEEE